MLAQLSACPGPARLKTLGQDRAGEARLGRFLRNHKVTTGEMVEVARAGLAGRVAGLHVLAIQDTTSLHDASNTTRRSLHLHPSIAVDAASGALLGLVGATVLHRSGGKRADKGRTFADKESRRWLDAATEAAGLLAAGASRVTAVMDREGDVFETFAQRPAGVDLVVRARHDRPLTDGSMLLSQCLDGAAELGRETIDLPSGTGRPRPRRAELALRARPVRFKAPKTAGRGTPAPSPVDLWLVEALEVQPPAGVKPAHWMLLTTHPAATLAEARAITAIYRQRWTIEQVFRIMKTKGFDIEGSTVAEDGPYEKLSVAVLIASIQVLQMVREREGAAQRPLTDAFDPDDQPAIAAIGRSLEGRTTPQQNPHAPGTLAWATWICARLGGWNCYYGKPGPITLRRGILQLQTILIGWNMQREVRIR